MYPLSLGSTRERSDFYILVIPVEVGCYDKLETIARVLYEKHEIRYNGMLPIRPRPATYEKLEKKPFVRVMTVCAPRSTDVQAFAPSAHAVASLLLHFLYRLENQLDQSAQMGYSGDATQCVKTARKFRRGFRRNGDHSHKLQDASGFFHTDLACLCKKGNRVSASVQKGNSSAWLPRHPNKDPATHDETWSVRV